ncbi:MAG: hypothetical protein ACE5D8_09780 [Fidelibacterota bacterium]
MRKLFFAILLFYVLMAQTTTNPDFSVIGDIQIIQNDSVYFSDSGIELAYQGYVNPFAKASVYFHFHPDEGFELEEAYLAIERGLPLGLGLRAGVLRPYFGKINGQHAHIFPFIESPLSVQSTLGPEHWWANGVEINALLPFPWYSQMALFYGSDNLKSVALDGTQLSGASTMAGCIRWSNFIDLTPVTHLETGLSYYQEPGNENALAGADIKYKYRPNKYHSFTWQSEWFHWLSGHSGQSTAAYSWMNIQFNKRWNAGLILDGVRERGGLIHGGWGVFAGFSPVEESSVVRIKLERPAFPDDQSSLVTIIQLIWSLGPHKPHRF